MSVADKLQKFNIFMPRQKVDETTASMNAAFISLHDLRKEVSAISEGVSAPTVVHYRTLLKYVHLHTHVAAVVR